MSVAPRCVQRAAFYRRDFKDLEAFPSRFSGRQSLRAVSCTRELRRRSGRGRGSTSRALFTHLRRRLVAVFLRKRARSVASHFQEKHFRPPSPIRRAERVLAQLPLSRKPPSLWDVSWSIDSLLRSPAGPRRSSCVRRLTSSISNDSILCHRTLYPWILERS